MADNKLSILSPEDYENKMKNIKSAADLANFAQELIKPLLEATQNGKISKRSLRVLTRGGADKNGIIRGYLSENGHGLFQGELENQVIDLYTRGMTTTGIANHLKEAYGHEMSSSQVSAITDKVFPLVKEWQSRPLAAQYPVLYLDGLHCKVRDTGKVVSKCAYIVLGINTQGLKEVLGIWIAESEGAKIWLQILGELKSRGVDSVLITCVDGLKGFPEAIRTIYPKAEVQTCIVHQIRHTIMYVSHKDREQFSDDLRSIYTAPTEEAALVALEEVKHKWLQYEYYLKRWQDRWADLSPFFGYPQQIKRLMYTTNAIESLNSQLRKAIKNHQVMPHDEALLKALWLAQADITRRWTKPVYNWGEALAQFAILFPDEIRL